MESTYSPPESSPSGARRAGARPAAWITRRRPSADAAARFGVIALLLVLTTWLAFSDGGFDTATTAAGTAAALLGVLVLVTCAPRPLAGLSGWGIVAAGALTLLAIWTLASATWSHSPARAMIEFNRTLLYLAVFLLTACLPGGSVNARRLVRVVALALGAAALAGLLSRLDVAFSGEGLGDPGDRLGWPLGYWNALGLAAAMASIACLHLSSDLRERAVVRVFAAGAVPALVVTIYLTLSRGSIVAGALGVVVLLVLSRARGTLSTLVAVLPFAIYALLHAYGTESLLDGSLQTAAARTDAEVASRTIALACLGAALVRAIALRLDARLGRLTLWRPWSMRRSSVVVLALAGLVLAAGIVSEADSILARQWNAFVASQSVAVEDQRDRLAVASANGRIEHWQVAVDSWREAPLHGSGAGTYAKTWARERPVQFTVQDAHSLYLEVLAELGLVGLALLIVALAAPLGALLRRRRAERPLWSAVLALAVTWGLHAGIDWDWEMPAVTLPVVALLGAACARDIDGTAVATSPGRLPRLLAGLGILLLILTPVRLGLSQRYLEQSLTSFRNQDCGTAAAKALDAVDMVNSRSQAFELLGYCDARRGRHELAGRMLKAAQRRDPGSWDLHYGSALVRSVAGRDPRAELRRARELNPLEDLIDHTIERMDSDNPRVWIREGLRTPLPLPE